MKFHLALLALACTTLADDPTPTKQAIEGWGTALDPAKDCTFKAAEGKLTVTVPGSTKPHDLSPENHSSTAPRIVQPVQGDFIIQVRVDGDFQPGDESTQAGRTGYTGAGLVVFADEGNFVRLERATLHSPGDVEHPYTNFEIQVNGKLESYGTTGDFLTASDKPTWLRLERKGDQLLGSMSQDGEHWASGEPKQLRADAWTRDGVVAGVAAISTSTMPFTPTYSAFSLKSAAQPTPEKVEPK